MSQEMTPFDQRTLARPTPGAESLTVMVVEAAGIAFALPAPAVDHVTAPVAVTPLPLVPSFVDGLVGLGGTILPQIDLRRRLALPPAAPGDAGELLVVTAAEGGYALRVDRVVTLTALRSEMVRLFEAGASDAGAAEGLTPGMVAGEFSWRGGRTALLLHPDRLGLQELAARGGDPARDERLERFTASAPMMGPASAEPHHVYVLVRCGPGLFALPVAPVVEVVEIGSVTPVPGAPGDLAGLTQLRGRPLPVLTPSLLAPGLPTSGEKTPALTAGADAPAPPMSGVLVVVEAACGRFAIRVDTVLGVRSFPLSRIHASAEAEAEGRAGYLVDAHDRVIGLLDVDRLVSAGGAACWQPLLPPAEPVVAEAPPATRTLLVFRTGPEWCALDVGGVVKLAAYRTPVPVPVPDSGLAGIVEINGEALPALDLRRVMGFAASVDEWTAMIVVRGGEGGWAVATDRIDRLVVVPVSAIKAAETPIHPLVVAVIRIGDRLVSLLDLDSLVGGG